MAAGKLQEVLPTRPITYRGQNLVNLVLLALAVVHRRVPGLRPDADVAVPDHHRAGAGLRRAAGPADRRRRHADGDLAAELLRRPGGGGDGLRAREQAADHRRRARRIVGPDPVDHHVPGDEPLVHQRAVRRLRPGAGGGRGRRAEDGRRARPPRTRRRSSRTPARVVIVPGYGMAVAQAQHRVRDLFEQPDEEGRRREVRDPSGGRPHARAT